MLVTLSGIVTVSKLKQDWNALLPMVVTLSPIVTSSILLLEAEKYVCTNPFAAEPTSEVLITSVVIAEQPENALVLMLVMLSGILTVFKLEQPAKTNLLMLVILSGILTVSRLEHPLNA